MSEIVKSEMSANIECVPLLEFLKEKGISWMPINIKITMDDKGNPKKSAPLPYGKNDAPELEKIAGFRAKKTWFQENPEYITAIQRYYTEYPFIAINSYEYPLLDVDNPDINEEEMEEIKANHPYYLSTTKALPRVFMNPMENKKQKIHFVKGDDWGDGKVEIIQGWNYAKRDAMVYNPTKPFYSLTDAHEIKYTVVEKKKEAKEKKKEKEIQDDLDLYLEKYQKIYENSLKRVEDILQSGKLDNINRDEWLKVLVSMKNMGFSCEKAHAYCARRPDKYNPKSVDDLWDDIDIRAEGNGMSYILKLADVKCVLDRDESIKTVAEKLAERLFAKLKSCDGKWFLYNDETGLWYNPKKPTYYIVDEYQNLMKITQEIKVNQFFKLVKLNPDKAENALKQIHYFHQEYNKYDDSKNCGQLLNYLEFLLADPDFHKKLDRNPYKLAFKNGMLDLLSKTFRNGLLPEDYLMTTIPHDYEIPTEEQKEFVKNIIFKISNANQKHYDRYMSILGYSLLGDAEKEKSIFFLVGMGGNNGKTLLLDALHQIMPCYVCKIRNEAFSSKCDAQHKYLAPTKGARIGYVEELKKDDKLESSILKEIGDGKTINNKVMYKTTENIEITWKPLIVSNSSPSFESDGGLRNRFVRCEFKANFNKENTDDNYETLRFVRDNTLGDKLRGEYKHALLDILLDFSVEYCKDGKLKQEPEDWADITKETLEENDRMGTFCDTHLEFNHEYSMTRKELEDICREVNNKEKESKCYFKQIKDALIVKGVQYKRDVRHAHGGRGMFYGVRVKNEGCPEFRDDFD